MKRIIIALATAFLSLLLTPNGLQAQASQRSREYTTWIAASITKIQTIKVGMTRDELLKVFGEEGGLSSPARRTYVYRKCPYIKVDVTFTLTGRPAKDRDGRVTLNESGQDVIESISKPYLEWSIDD
jgi:hypothetical protein